MTAKNEKKKNKNKKVNKVTANTVDDKVSKQGEPDIKDIVTVNRLTKDNASFYVTKGGFIGLTEKGDDKGRVGLFRMTPISEPSLHISVRDMDSKELGIIFDIQDFPPEQQKIMNDELNLRYFTPIVKEITSIKEEYGYTFITAVTEAGTREFTMRDLSNNIVFLSSISALLIDTDGNRYKVENIKALGDKALRIIGVWA